MRFINIGIFWGCLLTGSLFAQSPVAKFRLLDGEDGLPIVAATFLYGDQQGRSDDSGVIRFRYTEGDSMILSHLYYGTWTLSANAVQRVIKLGVYYRKGQALDLYPVTIIAVRPQDRQPEDRLQIEYQERLEHDGGDLLNQLPAFNSIRKSGNYGFDPVFRGFKYEQLNVVLNGAQGATAACPNRMDPPTSQMAPNMMDRIEILKGPHALRYGTGFGATINFIPAKLRFSSDAHLYGRVSTGYESNGHIARGEAHVGWSGKNYDLSLLGSWSQGEDYSAGNGATVPADFSRGSWGTNLGFKLSPYQQLRISALYNRARDADFPALAMDLREDDTWMFHARHDIQFIDQRLQSWNTTVFGSFVDHLMDNLLKPLNPRMMNAETFASTYHFGGRTEGMWQWGKGMLYAGADLRVEGAEGARSRTFLMGPMAGNTAEDNAWQDGQIIKAGTFAEYQLRTDVLDYVVSGRLVWDQADIQQPSDEFAQVYDDPQVTQINPSISVGILKDFGKQVQTGLWLGRAQRSAGLTERFINYFPVGQDPFEMLGNPELDPEVNNQLDLTFAWSGQRMAFKVDLFAAYLQNYISSVIDTSLSPRLPTSPGVRRYTHIGEAFKTGFEISWTQQLFARLQHQVGIAYTYGQDLERAEALPEIAPMDLRYTLSGKYLQDKLMPELAFRYVMEQSRVSSEFGETVTPSFTLLDLKVAYAVNEKLRFNLGINNVLDENYYEHLNRSVRGSTNPIFAPGRNFFANISVNF